VGGYHNDMLRNTAYGAGATPEAIAAADAAIAELKAGTLKIYKGTLKDNAGNVVVDKEYDNYDPYLDGMNWLLEGVQGSIT
jgi:simple sugar transport system substrate-binding protein